VHGVIHAAGLTGSGLMAMKSREDAQRVLAPKVRGTQVLGELLAGRELDFLLLCSSISTATGVFAGVDYAAANAFMDAWANTRHGAPHATLSVCWDTWRDVGIATRAEVPAAAAAAFEREMRLAISPEEGQRAFERALRAGLPQVYVSTRDLRLRDELSRKSDQPGGGQESGPKAQKASGRRTHKRPTLSTEFVEPASETEVAVAGMWADLLGLDRVGVDDNFFELGGNSLVMMQVNVRLRSLFGISLPVRELFDLPDTASLAERIDVIRAVSGVGEEGDASEEVEEFTL
jgi:acyl carrier protein